MGKKSDSGPFCLQRERSQRVTSSISEVRFFVFGCLSFKMPQCNYYCALLTSVCVDNFCHNTNAGPHPVLSSLGHNLSVSQGKQRDDVI